MSRKLGIVLIIGLLASLLGACSGGNSGSTLVKDVDAAVGKVPGVVNAQTKYNNSAGMSTRINVRITASADADLNTVLKDSLHSFAGAAGSTDGAISVAFYVFPQGAENDGIGPDALGMGVSPTVDEIRHYANSGN